MAFVKTVLEQSGLTVDDIEVNIYADPEITAMMLTKQIDVCGGMGLPAVMELISKGFKMIVTASQIATSAKPSADSKELRTVFQVGVDDIRRLHQQELRNNSAVQQRSLAPGAIYQRPPGRSDQDTLAVPELDKRSA